MTTTESRQLNRELRQLGILERAAPAVPRVIWSVAAGVAYTRGEDDQRQTAIPLELAAQFNDNRTSVVVSGDAYVRSRDRDDTVTGNGDASVLLLQALDAQGALRAGAGVRIPGGSDVSSAHASQFARLSYGTKLGGNLRAAVIGNVSRTNADLPAGISRYAKTGIVRGVALLDPQGARLAWLQFLGSHRSGTKTYRELGAGYEFPLGKLGGALTVTRGLPDGARSTTVEFSVGMQF